MKNIVLNQRAERDALLAQPYLARRTRYDTDDLLNTSLIKLITGPRRVGKSTHALMMLQGRNFAYLNFDDNGLLGNWNEELVMGILDEVYPAYEYLLLDEVQNLRDWDLWVAKLYRRGKNLVITGSNAKMLSSEMATALTGRFIQVEMLPFGLTEFFEYNQLDINNIGCEQQTQATLFLDDYLRNGGYPEIAKSRNITRSYLATLFDSIIWKDVVSRHKVRNSNDLTNLATYLLANFTNSFTANELSAELNISSVNTTLKYLGFLREPYLFFYLSRYNNKLKLMKKAPQKVYVVDNGMISAKAFSMSQNWGRLLENQVFIELLRRGYDTEKSLFYYRSRNDKETDFVVRNGYQIERMIQVCYDLQSPKVEKREVDSLVECAEELNCDDMVIVTYHEEKIIHHHNKTIRVLPISQF